MPKTPEKALIVRKQMATLEKNKKFSAELLSSVQNIRKEMRNELGTSYTVR
jgi:hypothetical protein